MATEGMERSLMRSDQFWLSQSQGKQAIDKELTEQVKKRRKRYADLNDLLEKKKLVASLPSEATEQELKRGRSSTVIEQVDSVTHDTLIIQQKLFIKPEEITEAIEIALDTGSGVHGSQEGVTKRDILEFVQKIFDVGYEQMEAAEAKSSQQSTQLKLVCKVIKATDLKPKTGGNEPHDRHPYCRVGIVNQKHYHPGSKFEYLVEWQKSGDVTEVAMTDFETATLEPAWNEDIELAISNVEEDVVVVEVWDQPLMENSKKRRSRSFKGSKGVNKEDFLGWMFHPLLLVPIAGAELKFTLMSRGKKPRNGFITLFLSIQANTDMIPLEVRMTQHHLLTRALMNCFSKDEEGEYKMYWNGELCVESERLLQYHGALNGLSQLQMTCVRLSELLKYHKYESIDMTALSKVIKKLKEMQHLFPQLERAGTIDGPPCSVISTFSPSNPTCSVPSTSLLAPLSPSSRHSSMSATSTPPSSPRRQSPEPEDTQWIEKLFADLQSLEDDLMDTMKDHIRLINFGFGGKVEVINPYLSTLQELYTFRAYVGHMKVKKSLGKELGKCIEPAVNKWFERLKATVMPKRGYEPKELRDLCDYCLSWSEKVEEKLILHPTFTHAGVDYFTLYIMSLDEQLSEEVQRSLRNYTRQKPDTITFEIYTYFQQLLELSKNAEEEVQSQLTILGFHKWFEDFVPGWIDVATEKCEDRIRQAIEMDEIVRITDDLQLSASAVDTNGFLIQMATFWQHLQWPVPTEAFGYAMSLIKNMCSCAIYYVGEVFSSLRAEDWTDAQGRFKASEKLCVCLNDMFHVRDNLTKLPEHMELEKLYDRLYEEDLKKYSLVEEGGPEVSEMNDDPTMSFDVKAKSKINSFIDNTDEDIMNKIIDLVQKICQRVSPDIQKLVYEVVNSQIVETEDMDLVFAPLFDYLTQNLVTFGNHLLGQAFENVTANLWDVSVEAIERIMYEPRKKTYSEHHKLLQILTALREFYYCGGSGVSRRILDNESYMTMKSKLDILGKPTDQLIAHFYSEVVKLQQERIEKEKTAGELILSVGYLKETSVVEINVVHGDSMGMFYEPYVKLRLSSPCAASDKHWKTKPVKGAEKSPLFNEDFKLPLTKEEMKKEGALIMFHLIDRKSKNKGPSGACVVACKDIPHLSAPTKSSLMDPNMTQRKNLRLPFFQLTSETPALTQLISRAEEKDAAAMNFLKIDELLLHSIPRLNPKNKLGTLKRKPRASTST